MKKYIAVFEVPDGYKPTDFLSNADGWFTDEEGNRCTIGTKLEEAKEGEWIGNAFDEHHCNRCGHPALWEEEPDGYYEVQSRFCPNCGLPMKKGGAV